MKNSPRLLLALALCVPLAGCGSEKQVPVKGEVVFRDGKPMPGGRIEFERQGTQSHVGVNFFGDIQPNGSFHFRAPPGTYRAILQSPQPEPTGRTSSERPPPLIHPRYERYDTSKLEFTVTADEAGNHFKIVVDKP